MGVQIATMKLQGQLVNKFMEVFPMKQYEIEVSFMIILTVFIYIPSFL